MKRMLVSSTSGIMEETTLWDGIENYFFEQLLHILIAFPQIIIVRVEKIFKCPYNACACLRWPTLLLDVLPQCSCSKAPYLQLKR